MVLRVVTFDGGGEDGGGVADGKKEEEEKIEELGEDEVGDEGGNVECMRLEFEEREEVKAANTGEESF